MDKLIVAEKNSVAKAIAQYLAEGGYTLRRIGIVPVYFFKVNGEYWASMGLRGHILDFDFEHSYNNWNRVEPGKLLDLEPVMVIRGWDRPYVTALVELSKQAREIILALDSDVEGEAIAYEVMLVTRLRKPTLRFRRALFSAVTRDDIRRAFSKLTTINVNLARKVFTRMVIDLKYGATFTRLLTLSAKSSKAPLNRGEFLSYGPCQTPVLNLVVQRALERENFKPEVYYKIKLIIEANGELIELESIDKFKNLKEAQEALSRVKAGKAVVKNIEAKRVHVNPPKPLETVELERRASRFLNIRSKQTLDAAEELYRQGYISYPRTETNIYPPTLDLRGILRNLTSTSTYGQYARHLLAGELRPTAGKDNDNAHPPIHPVKAADKPELMARFRDFKYWLIYDLVVRHFLATLSPPALIEEQRLTVDAGGVLFEASGLRIINDGYFTIYPFERPRANPLPLSALRIGMQVTVKDAKVVKRKTTPPPYLSESELLRLMRKYGIGTDATMQDHIHTNVKRRYFKIIKGQCVPTPLGKALITSLSKYAPTLIDPNFRSRMESMLSLIGSGKEMPDSVRRRLEEEAARVYTSMKPNSNQLGEELAKALRSMVNEKGA
ncbi:DNA topoisomerase [Caldivirga maquilingensis]|uniref:DNA topoisomerase n=1 Tax=Caldivirga maquilingensis (strain ATCC 700844 / DSM 13496 / JCM 10307 / IC-167) TaxID=397948 RepID=A8MA31_CALMQ|nr:DNA topoisomerase [Caldivirga maquilingensis]ABW00963.1 DNA topoisomerase type IA central domain protein [Caldivirga maquilingensis IC-167]